jgi:hypothetical protein
LSATSSASLNLGSGTFTVKAWVKTSQSSRGAILNKNFYPGNGWYIDLLADGKIRCDVDSDGTTAYFTRDSTVSINNNQWHQVVMVRTGAAAISVYVDGSASNGATSSSGTPGSVTNSEPLQIGKAASGYGPLGVGWFSGLVDAVEVSASARSATWISTQYKNEFSPSTFYTVGSQEIETATTLIFPRHNIQALLAQ